MHNQVQRIMLAVDGSSDSQRAAKYLAGFSLPDPVSVQVSHVLPPPPLDEFMIKTGFQSFYPAVSIPWDEIAEQSTHQMQEEKSTGEKLLANMVASLQASRVSASRVLLRGDAATELLKYTDENGIDLLVVGSRGLGPVKSWLLGSVSRKLVHHAGCSVLVVKGG
ncbi:MAG TPA: universal stress protein, partial [Anaerolineales bacterium]|nr:universal stress protein [Anaerolineales bacterium]